MTGKKKKIQIAVQMGLSTHTMMLLSRSFPAVGLWISYLLVEFPSAWDRTEGWKGSYRHLMRLRALDRIAQWHLGRFLPVSFAWGKPQEADRV